MALKERSQLPGSFTKYRQYKPFLRIEFQHCCAYCGIHEAEDGGSKKFHIDHYRPQKKFPDKENDYSNLFYSCSECNRFKGDFWPNAIEYLQEKFVLNPCDHDFDEHYDCTSPVWVAKTKTARWNVERLRLNSIRKEKQRQDRKSINDLIDQLRQQKETVQSMLEELSRDVNSKAEVHQKILDIEQKIEALERKIKTPQD